MLTATAVLIPVTFVALIISFALTRRLPMMPVVTAGMVLVFGALTLWLQDKTFIEIKLTVIYCLFGIALLGSMAFGKLLLPIVLDTAIHLDAAGWRQLTVRWGLFFFALAGVNEVLRHTLNWDQWVAFKTFGVLPITLAFALAQAPLIMRHETKEDAFSDEMWTLLGWDGGCLSPTAAERRHREGPRSGDVAIQGPRAQPVLKRARRRRRPTILWIAASLRSSQ